MGVYYIVKYTLKVLYMQYGCVLYSEVHTEGTLYAVWVCTMYMPIVKYLHTVSTV